MFLELNTLLVNLLFFKEKLSDVNKEPIKAKDKWIVLNAQKDIFVKNMSFELELVILKMSFKKLYKFETKQMFLMSCKF